MLIRTQHFFEIIQIHHRLSPSNRPADLKGRLSLMTEPAYMAKFHITEVTARCLGLFLKRRSNE